MVTDICDVIKPIKLGDDGLRGLGLVRGQSSPFPIYFAGRPYNTLTLPCESVIRSTLVGVDLKCGVWWRTEKYNLIFNPIFWQKFEKFLFA